MFQISVYNWNHLYIQQRPLNVTRFALFEQTIFLYWQFRTSSLERKTGFKTLLLSFKSENLNEPDRWQRDD